ncbi:MAG: zinc-binding dehydrogenase [Alphaproteobacteria bacterium]|nr:zinc-binding dehydrogenase [Alphaproteobacteria bacterium SS10]
MSETAQFRALVMRGRPRGALTSGSTGEAMATPGDVTVEELELAALPAADITLEVGEARLSFRDSLTLMGRDRWVGRYPHIAGSEFVGTVIDSNDPRFSKGQQVFAGGHGLGERYWGGFAERVRLIGDWLMPVPQGVSADAMIRGGLPFVTAQMVLDALNQQGFKPEHGPVLVTHLSSEVGIAVFQLLRHHGFETAVATDSDEMDEALSALGVGEVVSHRALLERSGPVLGKENWAAIVDTAGGNLLAAALSELRSGGIAVVAAPTLGHDLPGDLSPFVVRGCRMMGVNPQNLTESARQLVWERLSPVLSAPQDEAMASLIASRTVSLEQVPEIAARLLQGDVRGQVIVNLAS